MKKLWIMLLGLVSFGALAQADTNEIIIRSELASPVVLVDEKVPNYLKVSLKGFPVRADKRPALNLTLVVDRSGSMSGDRIEKAREAAIMAVEALSEQDTLSIVAYDSGVEVIVPAMQIHNKKDVIQKINRHLKPQGMTALFLGLSKGIEETTKYLDPNKVNRIILLSDGQANVGPNSVKALSELAKIAAQKGIAVSTFGIGNDYNEDLMTAIASYSDGNHAYVANVNDLEHIMDKEFRASMSVAAQNFEITIELEKGAKPLRLLGRDGEIRGNKVIVNMNQVYADQEKYVLLELEPMKGQLNEEKLLANVDVRYTNAVTKESKEHKMPVTISYTNKNDVVAENVREEVLVDSIVQKIAIEQEIVADYLEKGDVYNARKAYMGIQQDWGTVAIGRRDNPFIDELQAGADEFNSNLDSSASLRYATGTVLLKSEKSREKLEKRRLEIQDYGSKFGLKGSEDLGNGASMNELRKSIKESVFKAKQQQD